MSKDKDDFMADTSRRVNEALRKIMRDLAYLDNMNPNIAYFPITHKHTMIKYEGFTDTYNYCSECGEKE